MPTLAQLRDQLNTIEHAVVLRDYNPNQPREANGRFGAGSGSGFKDQTVPDAPREPGARLSARFAQAEVPGGITTQCARCGKMLNGPMAGKSVGYVVRTREWSHGLCPTCIAAFREQTIQSLIRRGRAGSREEAEAMLAAARAHVEQYKSGEGIPPMDTSSQRVSISARQALTQLHLLLHLAALLRYKNEEIVRGPGGKIAGNIGVGSGSKTSITELHAASRAWQAANPSAPREVRLEVTSPKGAVVKTDNIQPITSHIAHEFNPYAPPDPHFLAQLYGEHQLGAVLDRLSRGNYHVRSEPSQVPTAKYGGKSVIAPWNAAAKREFASVDELSAASRLPSYTPKAGGGTKSASTEHPQLAGYRDALARLREQYAALHAARPDLNSALTALEKKAAPTGGTKSTKTPKPQTISQELNTGKRVAASDLTTQLRALQADWWPAA